MEALKPLDVATGSVAQGLAGRGTHSCSFDHPAKHCALQRCRFQAAAEGLHGIVQNTYEFRLRSINLQTLVQLVGIHCLKEFKEPANSSLAASNAGTPRGPPIQRPL